MKRIVLVVALLLFTLPLFAQDESMPAYLLIRLVDRGDPADLMSYLPGYMIDSFATNQYGGKQILPKFGQIVVSDATVGDNKIYNAEWKREIEFDILSQDLPNDIFSLKAYVKPEFVSQSGLNSLTQEQVETYLQNWNATVRDIAQNSVTFQAGIFNAIQSNGFWGMDVSGGAFTELSYTQATAIHSVRINYSGIPGANQNNVASAIVNRGCTVTGSIPAQSRMTFTCTRQNVYSQFKADVQQKVNGIYARRKWRVTQAAIDAIVANGGTLVLTRDQLLDLWHSRLND